MARIRSDQPDGLETATDVIAETAETASDETLSSPEETPSSPDDVAATDEEAQDTEDEPAKRYRVVRGTVAYPSGDGEKRAEEGDEIDDISDDDAEWLVADGILERI